MVSWLVEDRNGLFLERFLRWLTQELTIDLTCFNKLRFRKWPHDCTAELLKQDRKLWGILMYNISNLTALSCRTYCDIHMQVSLRQFSRSTVLMVVCSQVLVLSNVCIIKETDIVPMRLGHSAECFHLTAVTVLEHAQRHLLKCNSRVREIVKWPLAKAIRWKVRLVYYTKASCPECPLPNYWCKRVVLPQKTKGHKP